MVRLKSVLRSQAHNFKASIMNPAALRIPNKNRRSSTDQPTAIANAIAIYTWICLLRTVIIKTKIRDTMNIKWSHQVRLIVYNVYMWRIDKKKEKKERGKESKLHSQWITTIMFARTPYIQLYINAYACEPLLQCEEQKQQQKPKRMKKRILIVYQNRQNCR